MPPDESAVDRLLARNADHAAGFTSGGRAAAPALRLAVVACMDARLDVAAALGLEIGDAHVIRNAGGVVTPDVIRSLALSQHLLGTDAIVLVHHTRCGLEGLDEAEVRERLTAEAGVEPPWRIRAFTDAAADVRTSLRELRRSPFLAATGSIRGFVYDVDDGRLVEVEGG